MKALKGLMVYIGIVLAIIVLLCVGLFGVMYFVPSFKIMGVGVVNTSTAESGTIFLKDYEGITNIQLNVTGENIDYSILPYKYDAEEDKSNIGQTIDFDINVKLFGISFDSSECRIIKNVERSGELLKVNFNITETNGLLSRSGKGVTIKIPNDDKFTYDMFLNIQDANISLGSDYPVNIHNLSVSTNNGNLHASNLGKDVEENGKKTRVLELLNLSLQTSGMGNFDFSSINTLKVENSIRLTAKMGDFKFQNIEADVDARGNDVALYADTITTKSNGLKFLTESGHFEVVKIVTADNIENMIVTNNCQIIVDEIWGKTGIDTEYGDIKIETLHNKSILYSKHGNIDIFKANDYISAESEFGDIEVDEYYHAGIFKNVKGNITVTSKSEYDQEYPFLRYTDIQNVDGNIKVNNNVNRLLVDNMKGTGKAEIVFHNIQDNLSEGHGFQHVIKLNSRCDGYHEVKVNTGTGSTPFKFKAIGTLEGEIAGFQNDKYGSKVMSKDELQFYPSNTEENKNLSETACFFYFEGKIRFGRVA